ncbi:hypothetical protein CJ030_MR7G021968 [Morella rubra]|uniref:Uncharacterized protein n=1 Tax=Morella rubra TaxID=262757 RepID=A0A6A1UXM6_9ROSI|nr:hypothetical protein CJ030_MR7G021968 [Morella rubra]
MMMSMFSSFDALCAESYGQKVSLSMGPTKEPKPKPKERAPEGYSTPPKHCSGQRQPQEKQQRMPRFAPELDGVHCFETIVPY